MWLQRYMNIRTQLILSYIGIVLLVLFSMGLYLRSALKGVLDKRITSELEVQAALTREFLIEQLPKIDSFTHEEIDSLVDRLGEAGKVRLTFIGTDGTVWGDTEREGGALIAMDDHSTRREVQDAKNFGSGMIDRVSMTTETEYRYFALPVERNQKLIGFCRVALPKETINSALGNQQQMLLYAGIVGLILAILIGIFSTGAIVKPIKKLTQITQSIAGGEISSRVEVNTNNELGQLLQNFNLMTDRVHEQIDKISVENQRLETILNNMNEGVLLVNGASEITYANPAAVVMLNLPDMYVGRALIEINRIPELQALLLEAEQTDTVAYAEIRLGNLMESEAEVTIVPVAAESEYVIVIHDVSHVRKLERIRADFVANVSHELRTPLTTIHGYAETLLNSSTKSKKRKEFIIKILKHSARLSRLVSDLLELARLESGDVELKRSQCHLNSFHEPILDVFEPVLEESGLVLNWDIPESLPQVNVDHQLFMQVFVNLIDNAIKYTPDGGEIEVSAELSSINSDVVNEVVVHVKDTGIGIPLESQSRVFERFYRVDTGRARKMGGTGLGLAITKHILLCHNGRIWLESELGQGTVFHFVLPIIGQV
ncbi:cell wall metabolism sensor histidine kinase WalK [Candidatus Poribacteria bacterium]|nr:cell wall metabolism sensor histidine kinase WalK [Candidatus Poribacteria bacterium]